MEPTLTHYLALSAVLFSIGTAGVFLRRNLITVLLSIEIMLNAVNLTFVAAGRHFGTVDGQVIVFFVMTVAAAEAAVGLALDHRAVQAQGVAEPGRVHVAQVVTMLSLIPLLPFTGFLINATLGRRLTKGVSGAVACLAMLGAFGLSATAAMRLLAIEPGPRPRHRRAALRVDCRRQLPRRPGVPPRPAVDADDPRGHRHRLADPHLLDRLHARGDGGEYARYFSYLNLFASFMLDAGARRATCW